MVVVYSKKPGRNRVFSYTPMMRRKWIDAEEKPDHLEGYEITGEGLNRGPITKVNALILRM
jgi:hypothetical protein